MTLENRRAFIKKAGFSAITAAGLVNLNPRALGANERVLLALVGAHNRGMQVAEDAIEQGAIIKTLCDIDLKIIREKSEKITALQKQAVQGTQKFEEVLNDREVDAVILATPDHWHAIHTIQACRAGKDVYVEKPLCHTIYEGQQMVAAARKYKRVVQVGTQRRSMPYLQSAVGYAASGKLGKICLMKAWMCQVRGDLGNPPDEPVPDGVDYDTWLGPAPKRPFNKLRFHYNWRFFWDYCNSEEGNQGVHMLDICMWAMQKIQNKVKVFPTTVSGHAGIYWLKDAKEVPDTQVLTYDFGDWMLTWELHSFQRHAPLEGVNTGIAFHGSDGSLLLTRDGWKVVFKDGKEGPSEKASTGSHIRSFLDCMKTRGLPNCDVEIGRVSTLICHLGNIQYHVGRDLRFDPETETFGDDKEANGYLKKEYREPFVLPEV
ncbi:MAG TPA: Gfo/Idh/MocA family oxidoreductase [bacterium]|nr:Gfo/Idh/MocA family oxidoreductase [bacterium]HQL62761.1 Gfo/Idh/MocA family oxidoreductase [bacterium]